jgi:hypothetical protein
MMGTRRRILGRVLKEIAEHPLDQYGIEFKQRQMGKPSTRTG